jgi:hypothetical protein
LSPKSRRKGGKGKKKRRRQDKAAGGGGEQVKQKEQGAQMAVDSRGVGKAVCWPPRGQYGNGIKIAGQFLGFLCMPFAEK